MGARVTVRVTPRSGRDEIEAGAGGVLAVRVTAAPDDGKANRAVCRLVADAFGVPKTSVSVVSGRTARVKILDVAGVDPSDVERLLAR